MEKKNKPGGGRPVADWTPDKVKLLKKLYPITPTAQVAKELNMTVSAVKNASVRFGIKKKDKWTEKDIAALQKYYNTHTFQQIADKLGKTRWAVINKARELKLTPVKILSK